MRTKVSRNYFESLFCASISNWDSKVK